MVLLLGYTGYRAWTLSFTYDESWTIHYVRAPWIDGVTGAVPAANNHVLNTLLTEVAWRALGSHEIVYRLPNLFAHALYLGVSLLWVRWLPGTSRRLFAFALLNFNPFVLDFFSLARGYGLASAFTLAGLYLFKRYLDAPLPWRAAAAFGASALAVLSNFALLNFHLSLVVVYLVVAIDRERQAGARLDLRRLVRTALPPGVITAVLGALIALPLYRLIRAQELYFGGERGFWSDAVGSLVQASLYEAGYADTARPMILVTIAVAVTGLAGWAGVRWMRAGWRISEEPLAAFTLLLFLPALASVLEHHLFGTPYPLNRTALPFATILAACVTVVLEQAPRSRALAGVCVGGSVLLAAHLLWVANVTHVLVWKPDADVKRAVERLRYEYETEFRQSGRLRLTLNWPLKMAVGFYRDERGLDWLDTAVTEYGEGDDFDFFLFLDGRHDFGYEADPVFLELWRERIVESYPVSGTYLIRGEAK